jgi:hypothetical protein
VGFSVIDQLLVTFFLHLSDTGEKKWEYNVTVHKPTIQLEGEYCTIFSFGYQ